MDFKKDIINVDIMFQKLDEKGEGGRGVGGFRMISKRIRIGEIRNGKL